VRVLGSIQRNPGITQKELLFETGLKRITAVYNLKKLIDIGVACASLKVKKRWGPAKLYI
jgi:DNA-binding MarR family transcriptional regulator